MEQLGPNRRKKKACSPGRLYRQAFPTKPKKNRLPKEAVLKLNPVRITLRSVSEGANASDTRDGNGDSLGEVRWVGFASNRVNGLHVVSSTNEVGGSDRGDTVLEEVLVGSSGELTSVVQDSFVLGGLADLLEGWDSHGSEETNDDHNDHDFDEGEALAGVINTVHIYTLFYYYNIRPEGQTLRGEQIANEFQEQFPPTWAGYYLLHWGNIA